VILFTVTDRQQNRSKTEAKQLTKKIKKYKNKKNKKW